MHNLYSIVMTNHKGPAATETAQESFKGVSRKFQIDFMEFHGSSRGMSLVFQGSFKNISSKFNCGMSMVNWQQHN